MAEIERKWRDNAFWHDINKKDKIEAILLITDESSRVISQQVTIKQYLPDGNVNPDFKEIISQVTEKKITSNTEERTKRKQSENKKKRQDEESKRKISELERLFESKVKTLEVEEIKNSKNTVLKSKLRRSKNIIEMQTIAQLIMMEEMGVKFIIEEKSDTTN